MERAISGERSVSAPNRIKLIEFKDGEDDFFPPSPPPSRSIRPFLSVLAWAAFRRCTSRNYGELSAAGRRRFVELSKT